jgi:hypothetical protein
MTACSTTQYNVANAQTPRFNMPLFLHLHCAIEVGYCLQVLCYGCSAIKHCTLSVDNCENDVSLHSIEERYVHCLSFERHPSAARIHCPPHIGERASIALGVNSRQLVHDRMNSMLFSTQNLLYTLSILSSLPQSSIHSHE